VAEHTREDILLVQGQITENLLSCHPPSAWEFIM
jgi:hypothetical protein